MYRKEIKIIDCTVRDGGLMNEWRFPDEFVKGIYDACVEAGVDYMEIGYLSDDRIIPREKNGPWKFCDEQDVRRIVGDNRTGTKLSAMVDIGRVDVGAILPKSESVIDLIRVACYIHQVDKAIHLAEHCLDKGYEVAVNLMAVSKVQERALDEGLNDIARSRVPVFYLVDSFGSLYGEQIQDLVRKYRKALPDKTIGIHTHNNMQLAFANTVTGITEGCNMLDATMFGLGRGPGNCPLEILISFLKNPKYRLLPILGAIQTHLLPLQERIHWGYHIPYFVTGALNEHPKVAIEWMNTDKRNDFVAFLKSMYDNNALLE